MQAIYLGLLVTLFSVVIHGKPNPPYGQQSYQQPMSYSYSGPLYRTPGGQQAYSGQSNVPYPTRGGQQAYFGQSNYPYPAGGQQGYSGQSALPYPVRGGQQVYSGQSALPYSAGGGQQVYSGQSALPYPAGGVQQGALLPSSANSFGNNGQVRGLLPMLAKSVQDSVNGVSYLNSQRRNFWFDRLNGVSKLANAGISAITGRPGN